MLFKPYHIWPIIAGVKTQTRRVWTRRRARPGSVHLAHTKFLAPKIDAFATLLIKDIYSQPLGDMTEEDAWAEGGYTLKTFRKGWPLINGSWDPDQIVWVVRFESTQKCGPFWAAIGSPYHHLSKISYDEHMVRLVA
jgi:hypothetical protein